MHGKRHERFTLYRTLLETMRTETHRDYERADRSPLDALASALERAARLAGALEFDPAVHTRAPAVEPQTAKESTDHA